MKSAFSLVTLLILLLLPSCRAAQDRPDTPPAGEIYVLQTVPTDVACTWIATDTLTDGNGCGQLEAGTAPAYAERLRFNLRKRAQQAGANLVVTHQWTPGPWLEGCARNQMEVRFSLYRCAFRNIIHKP